jgi:hypothetical protein
VLEEMNERPSEKLRIEYINSHSYRMVRADGAFCGTSPRLELFISFYNERFPIPRVLVYQATDSGTPGEEILEDRESKEGIIREVEVGITMDLPTAKSFAAWLTQKVGELEKTRERVLSGQPEGEEVKG